MLVFFEKRRWLEVRGILRVKAGTPDEAYEELRPGEPTLGSTVATRSVCAFARSPEVRSTSRLKVSETRGLSLRYRIRHPEGLSRVRASGGAPEEITSLETGDHSHRWPQVLPGADAALFTVQAPGVPFDDGRIW